ncbi:MAG: DUF3857 domain-containing protein [Candidatus Omnitrophica bacterium]|nr:DUF3857 domain-containing protein [Candidatus Omnitrophota bacterium]
MFTINTKSKLSTIFAVLFCCLFFITMPACTQENNVEQAQESAKKSDSYYEEAVIGYKALISGGRDLDKLHLELGKLYYSRGNFEDAIKEFGLSNAPEAKMLTGIALFRKGDFVDANEIFSKNNFPDDQALYYYGLTSEKLNLFDQALGVYKKIKSPQFKSLAYARINSIEKKVNTAKIKEVSPQAYKIIADCPQPEEYPQAGALILLADENIEITKENTQVFEIHYLIKIINERGKESFSETHIDYDSTFEKIDLEFARTIKPDGTIVDVGSRHIRDVSRYLNFPLYSNAKVFIISFPEITEGAVIEYKVKIYRNRLVNEKDFCMAYPVQASEPIIKAKFGLKLPKGRALHIKKLNSEYNNFGADLEPKVKENGPAVYYSWEFKDIPQIMPEANMPPHVEINPAVIISTFSGWEEIYAWWKGLSLGKIKTDKDINNKVKELIKNKHEESGKAAAIYNFCAKDIRYVAVEYGQAGYEPHSAADIFRNKYGDCKDQAVLLVAMLKEAGINAYPVLIPTRDAYNLDPGFPSMLFNHAIAAADIEGKLILMDPTAETCSFGDLPSADQERKVLLFKPENYQITESPLYPAGHNFVKHDLRIQIKPDETLTGEKTVYSLGVFDQAQRYWLLYTPPELIGEALRERIQEISIGAKLENYDFKNIGDLDKPVILSYQFWGPEYFTNAGDLRIMPQLATCDVALVAKEKRKYAIDFGFLDSKEIKFMVAIPPQFVIKYIPENLDEDSPWLKFHVEYSRQGNKLNFLQKTELKKRLIPEAEYDEFKSFFESLAKKIKQRVILEKVK